jgi:hypothetical protein
MLKKRLLLLPGAVALLFLPLSCDWEGGVKIIDNPDLRGDMVYAGEDSGGNWVTLAFRDLEGSGPDVVYFVEDGAGSVDGGYFYFSYSYDKESNRGSFAKKDGTNDTAPVPSGSFRLEAEGSRLVFDDSGLALRLVRNQEDLAVPFAPDPLPSSGSLDGTVWAAQGFRYRDWTTLSIVSAGAPNAGTISVSHSFDATRFYRGYADYDPATGEGTLSSIGQFKIEGDTFTFLDFYGHGGRTPFKRMR